MMLEAPTIPTVACVFGPSVASAVARLSLDKARHNALRRLEDLIDTEYDDCLASAVVPAEDSLDDDAPVEDRSAPAVNRYEDYSAAVAHLTPAAEPAEDSSDHDPAPSCPMTRSFAPWDPAVAIMTASGTPADDRPCKFCHDA